MLPSGQILHAPQQTRGLPLTQTAAAAAAGRAPNRLWLPRPPSIGRPLCRCCRASARVPAAAAAALVEALVHQPRPARLAAQSRADHVPILQIGAITTAPQARALIHQITGGTTALAATTATAGGAVGECERRTAIVTVPISTDMLVATEAAQMAGHSMDEAGTVPPATMEACSISPGTATITRWGVDHPRTDTASSGEARSHLRTRQPACSWCRCGQRSLRSRAARRRTTWCSRLCPCRSLHSRYRLALWPTATKSLTAAAAQCHPMLRARQAAAPQLPVSLKPHLPALRHPAMRLAAGQAAHHQGRLHPSKALPSAAPRSGVAPR